MVCTWPLHCGSRLSQELNAPLHCNSPYLLIIPEENHWLSQKQPGFGGLSRHYKTMNLLTTRPRQSCEAAKFLSAHAHLGIQQHSISSICVNLGFSSDKGLVIRIFSLFLFYYKRKDSCMWYFMIGNSNSKLFQWWNFKHVLNKRKDIKHFTFSGILMEGKKIINIVHMK